MPDKKREEASREALKYLRMLLAGGGNIQGNYYAVISGDGKDAALAVTLTAKDKNGMKAATAGKALRATVKKPKFSMGRVTVDGKKLTFSLDKGNATAALLKKGFRDVLAQEKGLSFLKKVRFTGGDDASEPEDIDEGGEVSVEELGLSAEALEALAETLKGDPELADFFGDDATRRSAVAEQDRKLLETFLTVEAAAAEEAAIREQEQTRLRGEIDTLSAKSPRTPEEDAVLKQARADFAALQTVGPTPPTTVGSTVPPETGVLLDTANDENASVVDDAFQKSARRILSIRDTLLSTPEERRSERAQGSLSTVTEHHRATVTYDRASRELRDDG